MALLGKLTGVKLTFKSLRRGFGCYWAARVSAQVLQKAHAASSHQLDHDVLRERGRCRDSGGFESAT